MLTIENLSFTRGAFTLSANLRLEPGLTAVIGSSGSGKSTLLSLIAGFDLPDRGRILWHGADITTLAPGTRPVSTLFQDNNLFPHLDVLTNVALGASPKARPTADAKTRAKAALDQVGLVGLEARMPKDLSGGQQSRAALARALLTDRPVVLMDEAFSALGPALKAEMLELTMSLMQTKTVLMVTHDPDDAKRCARATIFVEGGAVSPPVSTDILFEQPPEALAAYLT
ncbi:MAG: ATP-binding cassette domain-containing protein [Silicimonas sp.]|nr:ATP-binding cassette domain-containing protein [Silicimonas sp.]